MCGSGTPPNDDWYDTRRKIGEQYGYDKFPGACHMVPNHALIILALLHGNGDFRRSLMIANTAGWDTDCNAGNVGAILGIRDGLAAFDRVPRLPRAGGRQALPLDGRRGPRDFRRRAGNVSVGECRPALAGEDAVAPKDGARFHFSLPGSMQGFTAGEPETATVSNVDGQLAITLTGERATVTTPTFTPRKRGSSPNGVTGCSPPRRSIPGQVVSATMRRGGRQYRASRRLAGDRTCTTRTTPCRRLVANRWRVQPGDTGHLTWTVPAMDNTPIQQVGLRIAGAAGDTVRLDRMGWTGTPDTTFRKGTGAGDMWREAWVDGVDIWEDRRWPVDFQLSQNHGTGLIAQGTEEWTDYTVSATVRSPLAEAAGIAARIGGMRRYYALVSSDDGKAEIV